MCGLQSSDSGPWPIEGVKPFLLLSVDKLECVQKRENGKIFFVKFTTYEEQCKELVLQSLRVKEDSDHKNCFYLSKVCYGQEGPKGER